MEGLHIIIKIEWLDSYREPQCEPNPDYPNGIDIDCAPDKEYGITLQLLYPAKRCGAYVAMCMICKLQLGCTTAGRNDDPRTLRFSCKCCDNGIPDTIMIIRKDGWTLTSPDGTVENGACTFDEKTRVIKVIL